MDPVNLPWHPFWQVGKLNDLRPVGYLTKVPSMGIKTVISTDHIRSVMRNVYSKEQLPLIWASSYTAGECSGDGRGVNAVTEGFERQSDLIFNELRGLISSFLESGESLIVEVHNHGLGPLSHDSRECTCQSASVCAC